MDTDRRRLFKLAAGGVTGSWGLFNGATENASGSSGESVGTDAFEPVRHGFGFSNWEGDSGTDGDGAEFEYEPGDVSQEDVQTAIDESWTTALSEAQKTIMTRIVYSWIGGNAATNGHCYGMTFSADEYFQDPPDLPAGVESASEIERPTGQFDDVGDRIRRLQTSQLLRAEPYWFALLGLRWGLANHRESLRLVTEAIDETGTAGLALDGEANPHQVLGHGYERRGDVTDVFIYDPAYRAEEHRNPAEIWTLSVERESGDIRAIEDGYDSFLYHDPEMDATVLDDLIDGRDRVLDELSDAIFLGLEATGGLEIDGPDDVLVDRPDAEYASPERAPYNDSVLVLGSLDELELSVAGEDGEEFSLDVLGLRDGDLVLDEAVSDVLDGVSPNLQFTVDDAGEFVIDAAEEVAEESSGVVEEPESNDGANLVDDNWRFVVAGGAGAAGLGVAYWLLGDDENES